MGGDGIPSQTYWTMDWISTLILLVMFCATYIILCYMKIYKEKSKLPPGPTPLPFIGNLLQIDTNNMVTSLNKLKEIYGPVFTLYFGPKPGLVLCGYDAVKEALIDQADDFAGRAIYPVFSHYVKEHDMAFSNGEHWRSVRRFSVLTLRNFGMGKRSIEERIQEEVSFLVAELTKTKGSPTALTSYFSLAVANVISSVVYGSRFDYKDERLKIITDSLNSNYHIMSSMWGTFYNMYPALLDLLPGPHKQIYRNFEAITKITTESIRYHKKTLDPNCPRDYIDCFLIKMKREQDKESPDPAFYDDSLLMCIQDLLFGGTESVSTTLRYGILSLMKHPEIAARMQEELDEAVGRNRLPSMEDRSKMPYVDATIHEIMRITAIIPLSLPRVTTRETLYRGYKLPKGIVVTPSLASVLWDPSRFEEPLKFKPQNFLDESGCFKPDDALMPFAVGRRICPGETLARMELFIFITSLLQNFTFKPLIAKEEITLEPISSGLGSVPMEYECCITPR
uniref:Cytochrome P450 n=1 Tax=Leptobrachium leishanense TaxID=445787 RepID=A0A8C5RAI2_9ANUR